jgi:hypothetical protein
VKNLSQENALMKLEVENLARQASIVHDEGPEAGRGTEPQ